MFFSYQKNNDPVHPPKESSQDTEEGTRPFLAATSGVADIDSSAPAMSKGNYNSITNEEPQGTNGSEDILKKTEHEVKVGTGSLFCRTKKNGENKSDVSSSSTSDFDIRQGGSGVAGSPFLLFKNNMLSICMIAVAIMFASYYAGWNQANNIHLASNKKSLTSSAEFMQEQSLSIANKQDDDEIADKCFNASYNETFEELSIKKQVNDTVNATEFTTDISSQIVSLRNARTNGNSNMETILEKIKDSYKSDYPDDDFDELLDQSFRDFPFLMEDLSDIIEDEIVDEKSGILLNQETSYLVDWNPTILSEAKHFTFSREYIEKINNELVEMTIVTEDMSQQALEDSNRYFIQRKDKFTSLSRFLEREIFLELPPVDDDLDEDEEIAEIMKSLNLGGRTGDDPKADYSDTAAAIFKASPEAFLNIKNAYKNKANIHNKTISTFQTERLEESNETSITESAYPTESPTRGTGSPSASPSSSGRMTYYRYLRQSDEGKIVSYSKLEPPSLVLDPDNQRKSSIPPVHSRNTRRLYDIASQHSSKELSRRLSGLDTASLCSGGNDNSLACKGQNLMESAKQLDGIFCNLKESLKGVIDVLDKFSAMEEGVDKTQLLTKSLLAALQIGTVLPYGIGAFLKPAHKTLKPIGKQTIQNMKKTSKKIKRTVIDPWDRSLGKLLDLLDEYTFSMNSRGAAAVTAGEFVEDENACLADLLFEIIGLGNLPDLGGFFDTIQQATDAVIDALTNLVKTIQSEVWETVKRVVNAMSKVVTNIWNAFSPFEFLIEVMQFEITIPWFKLPYFKEYMGPALCDKTGSWDKDILGQNCYKKCASGFENVPSIVDWKCRPTCSSMGSHWGVGGCVNINYSRAQYRTWWSCQSGWKRIWDLSCRKNCNSGYKESPTKCYRQPCPSNFSPFLGYRYCKRNSSPRKRVLSSCQPYSGEVGKNSLGQCHRKCVDDDFDMGILGCFPKAFLRISLQDISDALKKIIDAIMDLPIVQTIEDALKSLIDPLLDKAKALVDSLLDKLGDLNFPALPENPLSGIFDFLDIDLPDFDLEIPGLDDFQEMFDEIKESMSDFIGPINECLSDDNFSQCVLRHLGINIDFSYFEELMDRTSEISNKAQEVNDIVRDCTHLKVDSKQIPSALLKLVGRSPDESTCPLMLPLPTCSDGQKTELTQRANELYQLLGGDNLISNIGGAPSYDGDVDIGGVLNIFSIDIFAPKNDIGFIESAMHKLHAIPYGRKTNKKEETFQVLSYTKKPSSKINLYLNITDGSSVLPIIEYESSIEWDIFTKELNTRSLLETVVASANVYLYEQIYWDLDGWCYKWDAEAKKYKCTADDDDDDDVCGGVCDAESALAGQGCGEDTCGLDKMELILADHPDGATFWKNETERKRLAECAIYLSARYNDAVDAKETWVKETRLASDYSFMTDIMKMLKIPLSFVNSDKKYFDGDAQYQIGLGMKRAKEWTDIESRFGMFGDMQVRLNASVDTDPSLYSVSTGALIDSFQPGRRKPLDKDKKAKNLVGLRGPTLIFSATKAIFNPNQLPLPSNPTRPPTPNPTRSPTPNPTLLPTPNPTPPKPTSMPTIAATSSTFWMLRTTPDKLVRADVWNIKEIEFYESVDCSGDKIPNTGVPFDSGHLVTSIIDYSPQQAFGGSGKWGGRKNSDGYFYIGMAYSDKKTVRCAKVTNDVYNSARELYVKAFNWDEGVWDYIAFATGLDTTSDAVNIIRVPPTRPPAPNPTISSISWMLWSTPDKVVTGGGAWDIDEIEFYESVDCSGNMIPNDGVPFDSGHHSVPFLPQQAFGGTGTWGGRPDSDGNYYIGIKYSRKRTVRCARVFNHENWAARELYVRAFNKNERDWDGIIDEDDWDVIFDAKGLKTNSNAINIIRVQQ